MTAAWPPADPVDRLAATYAAGVTADPVDRLAATYAAGVTADPVDRLAATYAAFSAHEARGRSPLYEELTRETARDRELLALLAGLPAEKQQPNLLLAAVRLLCGVPGGWPQFRACVFERRDEMLALILARRTQTNEPARCATLMPVLAMLPQPLALLEVGAAAGLCLLPDRYTYEYGGRRVPAEPTGGVPAPVFRCRASAGTPVPRRRIEVAWRAGLDVEPVDVADPDQVAWLESLVWPGEGDRAALLRAALEVARADPPRVVRGDLRTDLPALAGEAPADATLVVFHTAVLPYVPAAGRAAFAGAVRALDAVWLANEMPAVLVPGGPAPGDPWPSGRFLLCRDERPVAWTDPHGTAIDWLAQPRRSPPA